MTMKYTCGVTFLLERNAAYSGWVKKITSGTFGKTNKRRYAVIHEGILYLFNDEEALSTNDTMILSHYKLNEMERKEGQLPKYGFMLEGRNQEIVEFTVGSPRELKDWMEILSRSKLLDKESIENPYSRSPKGSISRSSNSGSSISSLPSPNDNESTDRKPMPLPWEMVPPTYEVGGSTGPSSLPPKPSYPSIVISREEVPEDDHLYVDPDQESSQDFTDQYLPPTVFKWSMDRNAANRLLNEDGTPGIYIIRKGKDRGDVISSFLLGEARHYKIFVEDDEIYLRSDHPRFRKHIDLIMYYHLNNLPTCHARLETPYR